MRLLSFHADGFGILAQTGAEGLGPGINIFLGDNEAGKSTCLAFLRAMLTGYPSGRKERQAGQPLRGGQAGGSLTLESGLHGLLHLHRRPGPGSGRLQLTGPDGAPVPESLLEQLFRGIDRQVYSNVFGFSLGELQRFESLDDEAVRHALYGASFGTGLRSPADVLRALQQQADAIYRPQGRKLPLNVQAGCWQELRARIRQADARSGSYDALCAQWQQRKQDLEDLRRRKTELETALRFAAERGVDVHLILPGKPDKWFAYALAKTHYLPLLSSGVKISEWVPGFTHAKVMIMDGQEAVVGTINLDYRSLYHHFENAVWMRGVDCLPRIEADFQDTLAQCRTVEPTRQSVWQGKKLLHLVGMVLKFIAPLI